jgi:FtsH-binding integral membrane protein
LRDNLDNNDGYLADHLSVEFLFRHINLFSCICLAGLGGGIFFFEKQRPQQNSRATTMK